MTRAVLQAGLSWKAIDARWESFVRLFESFDPVRVAAGELSTYYFVFRVGAAVPRFETWETTVAGDHPRMRATITHARASGYDETVALGTEDATLRS